MTPVEHRFDDEVLLSDFHPASGDARATIIVFPTVAGVSPLETGFAGTLNGQGFHVFLADIYGKEFRGAPREVGREQMLRLLADRASLARRLNAVVETVRALPWSTAGTVAIGFCFGGLCALDLARSGSDVDAVASFHGLFDPPGLPSRPIRAKVAAYHGWNDPMVPPQKVVALARELTAAGADWQILALGNTVHAFTNPGADAFGNPALGYNPAAAHRAWSALEVLLAELFPSDG